MQRLGQAQTQGAQRRVAGGDGQDDDAEQGDYTADVAEDIFADDADGTGSELCVCLLKAEVVDTHCARRPDHCYEALKHHHVIEGVAALTLALHGAGDDGSLSGVEAKYSE